MNMLTRFRTITRTFFADNDSTTPEGRAVERQRRVILSAITSGGSQVISVGLSFLMVPIALNYLGVEQYGLWTTLTTTLALFTFADLGIGNGLINAIGEAHGKNDRQLARSYISNGLALQLAVSLILAIIIFVSFAIITPDWQSIFTLSDHAIGRQASIAVTSLVGITLVSLPLTVAQRVRMGYQEGFVNNAFLSVGVIISFVAGIGVIQTEKSLAAFVACYAAGPMLAQLANSIVLLLRRPWLRPSGSLVNPTVAKALLRVGLLFFVLQLAGAIAFTSDNLVISSILGAAVVPQFSVPLKLFSLPIVALGIILQPLWPAYREAAIRQDHDWIRSTLRKSLFLSAGITVLSSIIIIPVGRPLIEGWTNGAVSPSTLMLVLLGIYTVTYGTANALAMFYNGLHIVRFQVLTAVPMAIVNIVCSIYLVRHLGPEGVVLGSIIAQVLCTFVPAFIFVPRYLSQVP